MRTCALILLLLLCLCLTTRSQQSLAVGGSVSLAALCDDTPLDQRMIVPVDQSLVGDGPSAMCLDKSHTIGQLSMERIDVSHEGLKFAAWVIVTFAASDAHRMEVFEKAHLRSQIAVVKGERVILAAIITETRSDARLRISATTDAEASEIKDRFTRD